MSVETFEPIDERSPDSPKSKLHLLNRLDRWRWQAPLIAIGLVLLHQVFEHTYLINLPRGLHFLSQFLFYGIIGPILTWLALTFIRRQLAFTITAETRLVEAHQSLQKSTQRLELLYDINRELSGAEDESEVVDAILNIPSRILPVLGVAFTRYDDREQPYPVIHQGELKPAMIESWAAHLESPGIREVCPCCTGAEPLQEGERCPMMLDGNPVAKVHCMSVARADRVYGRLMLFLKDRTLPEREHLDLLTVVAQDISMVIESQMLRTRELAAISQIQKAPRHRGLRTELSEMLQSIAEVMQVDGGLVVLGEGDPSSMKTTAATGAPTEDTLRLIRGIARGVSLEDKPLVINKLSPTGQGTSEVSSLMVTSLPIKENRKGILALWSSQENAFNKRHIQLAEVFSGQTAVAIDNHITSMQIAYQAELAERSRLAREIHDGIAQMLGLMKLQAGQIAQWLQTDQLKRAYEGISGIQNLATKAYMDAREAIDGLQIQSKEGGISIWIEEVLEQFSSLSGIEIDSNPPPGVQLAPEIQLQLIRITQEALSNIRKHSRATKVTLEWQDMGDQLALRICDNGIGFDVQDIPVKSQHGLHTMRERAELLDAELSITSNPKGGTKVYIQLPINTIGIPA